MHRFALPRLLLVPAAAAALLCSGCIVHLGDWDHSSSSIFGQNVETNGGVITVDDVELPHARWVDVTADLSGSTKLEVMTLSGEITLGGMPGTTATLSAYLYSEIEGDGKVVIENGRLLGRSAGDHKVFINAVKGTVPADIVLTATSGTGPILLEKLAGSGALQATNGTGDIVVRGSSAGSMQLTNGTGDIRVDDGSAPQLALKNGTGDVSLLRCTSDRLTLTEGTGDASLVHCTIGTLQLESGTGDLTLDGGKFQDVTYATGTGDFSQRNSPHIGSLKGH